MSQVIKVNTLKRIEAAYLNEKDILSQRFREKSFNNGNISSRFDGRREFGKDLTNLAMKMSVKRTANDFMNKIVIKRRIKKQMNEALTKTMNNSITIAVNKINVMRTEFHNNIQITKNNKNVQDCDEYIDDILSYGKSMASAFLPTCDYMALVQKDVNEKMRMILLDWLVDVHLKFKMRPETLFLTVNLVDRFLSLVNISRGKLQLLGVSAMFIASKYEEIYPPSLKDFVYLTDNAYKKEDVLRMENEILCKLEFNLTSFSTLRYLELIRKYIYITEEKYNSMLYVIEICLLDYKMLRFNNFVTAICAVAFVDKLQQNLWEMFGISYETFEACLNEISKAVSFHEKNNAYDALKRKYNKQLIIN